MTMLLLKRLNVTLDRDVIFLAESGEEGNSSFGMQFMVGQHFPEIEAEYCLAEGGGAIRIGGVAKFATVEAPEKIPRGIELVAQGISGHGSVPLKSNAIVHLAGAVAKVGAMAAGGSFQRDDRHLLPRPCRDLAAGGGEALPRRAVDRSEGARRRGRLAVRERAAALVDAADVGVAEHLRRRLPLERDSLGGEGDARRPHAAGRGSGEVPRAGEEGRRRSRGRRAVHGAERPAGAAFDARLDSELFKTIEAAASGSTTWPRCRR